jgi:eukaryotic-like serine/threonine-protein kinase
MSASSPNGRRYEPILKIASGGTASVWVGAAVGALGFRQLVAIKRPHEHLADDPSFVAALVEEAKIASRLRHANAVDVRDVEVDASGVQLVMDWVEGASLSDLIRAWQKEPPPRANAVAIRIVLDACEGLRALHELVSDDGAPLGCIHRDVSPANVLVGLDGVGRITDFGLARPLLAVERSTTQGVLRGKLGYMAPEYIGGKDIGPRVDVFATAVVLWESLAQKRLFRGANDGDTLDRVKRVDAPKLAEIGRDGAIGAAASELDALLARGLAKDPSARIASIAELATELERIARAYDLLASHADVREAFGTILRASLEERRREVQRILASSPSRPPPSFSPKGERPSPGSVRPPSSPEATAPMAIPPAALVNAVAGSVPPRYAAATSQQASRGRVLVLVVVVIVIVLGLAIGGVALALASRSKPAVAHGSPHVISSDHVLPDDGVRPREVGSSSREMATSSSQGRARRADKEPRPNPYPPR